MSGGKNSGLSLFVKRIANHFFSRLSIFSPQEKVSIAFLIIQTIFLLFFPIIHIEGLANSSATYIFAIYPRRQGTFIFPKLFFLLFVSQICLRVRHAHPRIRAVVSSVIGFTENPLFVTIIFSRINAILLMACSDTIVVINAFTSTMSLTFGYYVLLSGYCLSIAYCFYIFFVQEKKQTKNTIHTIGSPKIPEKDSMVNGLFDKMKSAE